MGVCRQAGQAGRKGTQGKGKLGSLSCWQPLVHTRLGPWTARHHSCQPCHLLKSRAWLRGCKQGAHIPPHPCRAYHPPTCTAMLQSTVWYWRMNSGNQEAFTSGTLRRARAEACRGVGAGRQRGGVRGQRRGNHIGRACIWCSAWLVACSLCACLAGANAIIIEAAGARQNSRPAFHPPSQPAGQPPRPPTLTTKSLRDSLPPLLAASVSFSCCLHGRAGRQMGRQAGKRAGRQWWHSGDEKQGAPPTHDCCSPWPLSRFCLEQCCNAPHTAAQQGAALCLPRT